MSYYFDDHAEMTGLEAIDTSQLTPNVSTVKPPKKTKKGVSKTTEETISTGTPVQYQEPQPLTKKEATYEMAGPLDIFQNKYLLVGGLIFVGLLALILIKGIISTPSSKEN